MSDEDIMENKYSQTWSSIQREPPLSVQILVLPIAFTLNWTFFQQALCKRVQRAPKLCPISLKSPFLAAKRMTDVGWLRENFTLGWFSQTINIELTIECQKWIIFHTHR